MSNIYGIQGSTPFAKDLPTNSMEPILLGKSSPTNLSNRRIVLGHDYYQTQTSRQLSEQKTSDGTQLPDAIAWENLLKERNQINIGSNHKIDSLLENTGSPTSHYRIRKKPIRSISVSEERVQKSFPPSPTDIPNRPFTRSRGRIV